MVKGDKRRGGNRQVRVTREKGVSQFNVLEEVKAHASRQTAYLPIAWVCVEADCLLTNSLSMCWIRAENVCVIDIERATIGKTGRCCVTRKLTHDYGISRVAAPHSWHTQTSPQGDLHLEVQWRARCYILWREVGECGGGTGAKAWALQRGTSADAQPWHHKRGSTAQQAYPDTCRGPCGRLLSDHRCWLSEMWRCFLTIWYYRLTTRTHTRTDKRCIDKSWKQATWSRSNCKPELQAGWVQSGRQVTNLQRIRILFYSRLYQISISEYSSSFGSCPPSSQRNVFDLFRFPVFATCLARLSSARN